MNWGLLLRLVTRWELLLVSGIVMVLIPLVSYIASGRTRTSRRKYLPRANRFLTKSRRPAES